MWWNPQRGLWRASFAGDEESDPLVRKGRGVDMAKKKTTKAAPKPPTKTEIYRLIAEETGLTRKDVGAVFDALAGVVSKNLGRRGPKVFTVPGLVKLKVVNKPATKARKGINPFTGEETVFKAKPARNIVKAQPLKAVKDMV